MQSAEYYFASNKKLGELFRQGESFPQGETVRRLRNSVRVAAIGLLAPIYFVAGKLGLKLAFLHSSVSPVWPAAGLAVAAFLLLGTEVWPAIFIGAFLVNLTTAGNVATSLGIAAGNTLEALAAVYLVNRFARGRHAFDRTQDILKFALLAGGVSACIGAMFGVTSLSLGGFAAWTHYQAMYWTWWQGDAIGIIVLRRCWYFGAELRGRDGIWIKLLRRLGC